jgi:type II secretory pathway pseudopilin PulG
MSYCTHCGAEVPEGAATCPSCRRPLTSSWQATPAARAGAPGPPPPPGAPPSAAPAPAPAAAKRSPAVWVVAGVGCLLAAAAVVGILAALIIPNFLEALHKAKQKRTVADLRDAGVALEHYRAENLGVPAVDDYAALVPFVVPEPLADLPRTDGWEHPLRYECIETGGPTGCARYRIGSPGRDGVWEHESLADYPPEATGTSAYERDIVYGDGLFVQSPEGP